MAFTRTVGAGDRGVDGLIVFCDLGRFAARYQAASFDERGAPVIVAESDPFRALCLRGSVTFAPGAESAGADLLEQLRTKGWQLTDINDLPGFGTVLQRPRTLPPAI